MSEVRAETHYLYSTSNKHLIITCSKQYTQTSYCTLYSYSDITLHNLMELTAHSNPATIFQSRQCALYVQVS